MIADKANELAIIDVPKLKIARKIQQAQKFNPRATGMLITRKEEEKAKSIKTAATMVQRRQAV